MTCPGQPEHSRGPARVKAALCAPRSRSKSSDTGLCASAYRSAIRGWVREDLAKHTENKKIQTKGQIPLDRFSKENEQGAEGTADMADSYRKTFDLLWDRVWLEIAKAETRQKVVSASSAANPATVGDYWPS